MENIREQFWENRWQQHQTGWDLGTVSPPLKNFIDTLENKNTRILIPGCGNAYEALYLIEKGFTNVTVIDIASSPVKKLNQTLQNIPHPDTVRTLCGNFFDHNGIYDLILEQTFFCAIDPSLRNAYADKCHELLDSGGKLAGVLFNREFEGGPPFGGNITEYQTYFSPLFSSVSMVPCTTSATPRLGSEVWIELIK